MIRPYFDLFYQEKRILSFGMLMTFFSSFGQTFFISLFAGSWKEEFGMGSGLYGTIYSAATLCSAAVLPFAGRWIDSADLRRFSVGVLLVMALGCLGLGFASQPWHLLPLFFMLRLSGQGLCGHVANTTMARKFEGRRGKALGISALGFPLGEGLFPFAMVSLVALMGWRWTCWLNAGIVVLVTIPLAAWLLAPPELREPPSLQPGQGGLAPGEKEWTRGHVLKDLRFYILLPNYLLIPFAVTGLIFHQGILVECEGWTMEVLAKAFVGFAATRILFSLFVGSLVDKFGARKLFPFVSVSICLGIVLVLWGGIPYLPWVYMSLMGGSMGFASSVGGAMWAEIYGTRHLGAIKSLAASMGIFGTALSPALFGWALEAGIHFHGIMVSTVVAAILAAVLCLPASYGSAGR